MARKIKQPKTTITLQMDIVKALNQIQSEFLVKGKRINYDYALRVLLKRSGNETFLDAIKGESE